MAFQMPLSERHGIALARLRAGGHGTQIEGKAARHISVLQFRAQGDQAGGYPVCTFSAQLRNFPSNGMVRVLAQSRLIRLNSNINSITSMCSYRPRCENLCTSRILRPPPLGGGFFCHFGIQELRSWAVAFAVLHKRDIYGDRSNLSGRGLWEGGIDI